MSELLPVFETVLLHTEAKALQLMNEGRDALVSTMGAPIDVLKRVGRGKYGNLVKTLLVLGLAITACTAVSAAPESTGIVPTTTLVAPLPTERATVTIPAPTKMPELSPTAQIDKIVIEGMGGVEPLDLKLTTEWTIDYEKMPKVTEADFASGAVRETVLEAWEADGKLDLEDFKDIFIPTKTDWFVEDFNGALGLTSWNKDATIPGGVSTETLPFRRTPEVFELLSESGGRLGLVGTEMVVFERPDGTIGVEPWFYKLNADLVDTNINLPEFEKSCFGWTESPIRLVFPDAPIWNYPLPLLSGPQSQLNWGNEKDWKDSGDQARQAELLKKVLVDGYPSPQIGTELLQMMCTGMVQTK